MYFERICKILLKVVIFGEVYDYLWYVGLLNKYIYIYLLFIMFIIFLCLIYF